MIVVTSEADATRLAQLGLEVAVAEHVNGNVRGCNVSVYAQSDDELADIIRKLKDAKAGVVMPLPTGLPIEEVPQRVTALAAVATVKHPTGLPSMALLDAARAVAINQQTPLWDNALDQQAIGFAEMTATTREFADAAMLACIGGIATGVFGVQVRAGWREPSPINVHLVASPGSGKSPLLSAITQPLFNHQIDAMTGAGAKVSDGRINVKGAKDAHDRFIWADATAEKISRDLACGKGGGLKFCDEADDHYGGGMSKYKRTSDRPFWKSAWSAGAGIHDRVGNDKPLPIRCLGVGLLTGIQPANLGLIFDNHNDGLADRAIFITTDKQPILKHGPESADTSTWEKLVATLLEWRSTSDGETRIPMSDDALAVFEDHRFNLLTKAQQSGREIDGWTAKQPAHIARIALLLTLAEAALRGTPPACVDPNAVTRAIAYQRLLNSHRRRARLELGASSIEHICVDLARFILESRSNVLDTYELRMARQVVGLRDEETLRKALAELHAARWISTPIPRRRDESLPRTVEVNKEVFTRT